MQNSTFYMVFVEGESNPTVRHASLLLAENEAKRLAEKTGKAAFVLCSMKKIEIAKFIETDMRPDYNDLPF